MPPRWSSPRPRPTPGEVFADVEKGPLTVLVYGLPLIVRIARAANIPLPPPTRLPELMARVRASRRRTISISRDEYDRRHGGPVGDPRRSTRAGGGGVAPVRLDPLRLRPALRALAGVTLASPAPWTTDRPAEVGKPRFLRRRPLHVDWSQGVPAPGGRRCPIPYRWLKPPDSSLVIDTVTGWRSKWAIDCSRSLEEQAGQVAADPLAHQDPLHRDVRRRTRSADRPAPASPAPAAGRRGRRACSPGPRPP